MQSFQEHGAAAALSVLGTLAAIAMILPNFTLATPGPSYSSAQMVFVGIVSLLSVRRVSVRADDPAPGLFHVGDNPEDEHARPGGLTTAISLGLLIVALVAVVLLAKALSSSLEQAVAAAGLPATFVGVVIAALVLLPEGMAAVRRGAGQPVANQSEPGSRAPRWRVSG